MTRSQLETALDAGRLEIQMASGNWWKLRRNGKTKTWKREPDLWLIPCKTGLKHFVTLGPGDLHQSFLRIV